MKKSKIIIIILSIMLTISVIGNIVLLVKVYSLHNKEEIENIEYVGKWFRDGIDDDECIDNIQKNLEEIQKEIESENYSGTINTSTSNSMIEIDKNNNVILTSKTFTYDMLGVNKKIDISKTIYKGVLKENTIIFKEKIDKDGNKEEIREIHNIMIYDEDTLAYYSGRDNNETLYIKK